MPKAGGYLVCVFAVLFIALKAPHKGMSRGRGFATRHRRNRGEAASAAAPWFGGVINDRSFTITAEVDVPKGGDDGMIVTEGG